MTVLDLVKPDRNAKLVAALKEALAQAEAGEIVGLAGIKLRPDSTFATIRSGNCSDLEMTGGLLFTIFDIIQNNKEGSGT